jgi:hypothetical protein
MYSQENFTFLRLRVVADADPGAIALIANRFRNLNVLPRRLLAEFGTNNVLHIEVDVFGLPEDQLALIAAKIREAPSIVNVYWHHL